MDHLEIVDTIAGFEKLKPIWDKLFEECETKSPFLSFEWVFYSYKYFGGKKKLFTLVIYKNSEPIGIAPLWIQKNKIRGLNVEQINFIKGPDSAISDFIVNKINRRDFLNKLVEYFIEIQKDWDILTFDQWPADSINYTNLMDLLNNNTKNIYVQTSSITPYVKVEDDWDNFLKSRNKGFRRSRRNILNRISNLDNIEFKFVSNDENGISLEKVIEVSKKGWKFGQGISLANKRNTIDFFKDITKVFSSNSWLMIWLLKSKNTTIAMEYDLIFNNVVYALRADFDENFKDSSPGAFLEYQILKYIFNEGLKEYQMGPGLRTYKSHWADYFKENISFNLCNNTLRGYYILNMEKKIIPFLKNVRDKFIKTD